jgi:hypothetical protein
LEEADETVFWLEVIQEAGLFPASKLHDLVKEANEYRLDLRQFGSHREGFTSAI